MSGLEQKPETRNQKPEIRNQKSRNQKPEETSFWFLVSGFLISDF
jgi:hypothetical protein